MFKNYMITALRNLKKGLSSALSQSVGLAIGLTVFILVNFIAEYEENFETFFKTANRIYTVYVELKPEAGFGMKSTDGIFTALQPVLEINIPVIEKSARLMGRELMVKSGPNRDLFRDQLTTQVGAGSIDFYLDAHARQPVDGSA